MSAPAQAFLAEASWQLARAPEYEGALERIGRLAVPLLASWCLIDVQEQGEMLRQVECADRTRRELARELGALPVDPSAGGLIAEVFRGGASAHGELDGNQDLLALGGPQQAALLMAAGVHAYLIVPVVAEESILGTLTLLADGRRTYRAGDQALAEDFGRRAGLALSSARRLREAQVALRARDDLLAQLAHDLRDPLTVMRGSAQIIRIDTRAVTTPECERLRRAADRIESNALKMAGLVQELIDRTRALGTPERRPVDLVRLVEEVVDSWATTSRQHLIELCVPDTPLIGMWDELRLYRVVNALVSNAVKYSPTGGEIRVTLARTQDPDGSAIACLDVVDHGVGIPAADLPRVFERHQRARNVGWISGHGLGLAAAHELVEEQGGTIAVQSYEGLGSRFKVRLPLGVGH